MADNDRTLAIEFAAKLDKMQRDVDKGLRTVVTKLQKMEQDGKKSFGMLERQASQAAIRMTSAFRAAGVAIGGYLSFRGIQMFAGFVTKSLDAAAAIKDVGNAANASTKYIQELRYAGSQLGLEATQTDEALTQLNKRLGDFRQTGAGAAANAIKALGLEQKILNGEFENTDQIMDEVLRRLAGVKSGSDRAALAASLFGKAAGPKMAEFLAAGLPAIREHMDEASKLGLVMGDDLINAADDASDKLNALSQQMSAMATKAVAENADAIIDLADAFRDAIPEIIDATRGFLEWLGVIDRTPERLAALIESLEATRSKISEFGPAMALVGEAIDARLGSYKLEQWIKQISADLADPWDGSVEVVGRRRGGQGAATFDPDAKGADRLAEGLARAAEKFAELRAQREGWRNDIESVGESRAAGERAADRVSGSVAADIERLDSDFQARRAVRAELEDDIKYALREGFRTGDWSAVFQNMLQDRLMRALDASIDRLAELLAGLLDGGKGGGGFGDILGSIFSAIAGGGGGGGYSGGFADIAKTWGRASGGPVSAGRPYIVGEKRPELFVPNVNGYVMPRVPNAMGGGGTVYAPSYTFNNPTVDSIPLIRAELARDRAEFARYVAGEPDRVRGIVRVSGPRGQI